MPKLKLYILNPAVVEMYSAGHSLRAVARAFDTGPSSVMTALKDAGIPRRPPGKPGGRPKGAKNKAKKADAYIWIIKGMRAAGNSYSEIAGHCGLTRNQVAGIIYRHIA